MYLFIISLYDLDGVQTGRLRGPYFFRGEDTFADVMDCLPDPPPGHTFSIKSWMKNKYIYGWPHTTIASAEENRIYVSLR